MRHAEMPSFQRSGDHADLRELFVKRLSRLIKVRKQYGEDLNSTGAQLIDRAIYATYQDCVEHGGGQEALVLMTAHEVTER